jgi:hypothetical protein
MGFAHVSCFTTRMNFVNFSQSLTLLIRSLRASEGSHHSGEARWNHPALPSAGELSAPNEAAFDVLRVGP